MALALIVPMGASGCVVEIVDPVGSDASVEGAWTVDGAAPTEESCAAAGITHVRVRVWDGATYVDPPSLVYPCAAGSFDSGEAVLRDGGWELQLLALDNSAADDVVVAEGPREYFDTLVEGGHVVMSPVDFVGGETVTSMQASWTINGATPTVDNCAGLGIDEVLVEIVSGPGAGTTLKAMCDEGSLTAEIDPGDYEVRVVASSLDTGELAGTELIEPPFTVAEGELYVINGGPIDYVGGFDPLGEDAALQASWTIGGVTADDKSCEAVLGSTIDILFYAADDTGFENGVLVASGAACADGAFDSLDPILAAGDYLLAAELHDSTGAVISRSETASPFTVAAGGPVTVDLDFRLDSATVHVFFEWEDPASLGTYTNCDTAGVDAMHWELYRDDGTASGVFVAGQDVGMNVACADFANIMGDASGGMLMPGDYELFLEGYESGLKAWEPMALCTLSIDDDGGLGLTTCRADFVSTP